MNDNVKSQEKINRWASASASGIRDIHTLKSTRFAKLLNFPFELT